MSIIFLAIAAASPVAPVSVPALQHYVDCVVAKATSLIPSGETADIIVKAALPSCENFLAPVIEEHVDRVLQDPIIARYNRSSREQLVREAETQQSDRYRIIATNFALQRVVEIKAKPKSQGTKRAKRQ